MNDEKWEIVDEVAGSVQGEILTGLLKAQGIPAISSQESTGHSVYVITVGKLANVQILVPGRYLNQARQVLDDYYAGAFEDLDDQSS